MPLSDTTCKNAHRHSKSSTGKPFKLSDEKGLYLLVKPQINGWGKWWRFKYHFEGKEKSLSFGTYPDTGLQQAREKRDNARKLLASNIDPGAIRKNDNSIKKTIAENDKRIDAGLPIINSFEHITYEWLASSAHLVREITQNKKIKRFEQHVFPYIGNIHIREITSPDILSLLKPLILKSKLETAHRVRSDVAATFSYAIAHGLATYDPAQAVLAQLPTQKAKHRAALTEPKDVA